MAAVVRAGAAGLAATEGAAVSAAVGAGTGSSPNSNPNGVPTPRAADASRASETLCSDTGCQTIVGALRIVFLICLAYVVDAVRQS